MLFLRAVFKGLAKLNFFPPSRPPLSLCRGWLISSSLVKGRWMCCPFSACANSSSTMPLMTRLPLMMRKKERAKSRERRKDRSRSHMSVVSSKGHILFSYTFSYVILFFPLKSSCNVVLNQSLVLHDRYSNPYCRKIVRLGKDAEYIHYH